MLNATFDSTVQRVSELADQRAGEIVAFAAELIRQPSVNPDLAPNDDAEAPAQAWLRDQLSVSDAFEKVDYWAEDPEERRPNVVATVPGLGGGRSLIWASHTDVVPVFPGQAATWSGAGPFSGEVRDGKLHGRGASDMKGAIAAQVFAARLLGDAGIKLQGDLTLVQTCGEESGRREIGCNAVLRRGYRADLAIFPEPSNFAVYPAVKGEIYFRLTVPGKSAHIADRQMVAQALPHDVERPGVSAIDNMLKYQLATLDLERQWLLWKTSPIVPSGGMFINLNTMHAGPPPAPIPDSSVPDSCEATGSMLFYPHLHASDVIAEVRAAYDRVTESDAWLREHPPVLDIPYGHPMKEPVNLPFDHPGVETIAEAMRALGVDDTQRAVSPFVCDANYWMAQDQPSLIFGPGSPNCGIHGTNEFIPVADLIKAVKAFAAVTMLWCGIEQ